MPSYLCPALGMVLLACLNLGALREHTTSNMIKNAHFEFGGMDLHFVTNIRVSLQALEYILQWCGCTI